MMAGPPIGQAMQKVRRVGLCHTNRVGTGDEREKPQQAVV
jgi:hypothetical protein